MPPLLRHADRAHLVAAQRALLSAPAAPDLAGWAAATSRAVGHVVGAEHTLFFLPDEAAPLVCSEDTAPEVLHAYRGDYENGRYQDDLLAATTEHRAAGPAGAYHEAQMGPRAAVEVSPFYQEQLRPHGIRHLMGLNVWLPSGEASVVTAYERADAPGFDAGGLALLHLLLPALQAGTRALHHLGRDAASMQVGPETLPVPLLVQHAGRAAFHNAALRTLLERDPEAERLTYVLDAWSHTLLASDEAPLLLPPADVRTPFATYHLFVHLRDGGETAVIGAVPERLRLPPAAALVRLFDLTPRQAEVARLLAHGLTDKEVASRLGIQHATARRHSEAVLARLGVHHRAAIALTLLRGAPPPTVKDAAR